MLLLLTGPPTATGAYVVNGEDHPFNVGWEVNRAAQNRAVLRCAILTEQFEIFRPALDQEILIRFPASDANSGFAGPLLLFGGGLPDDEIEFAGFITDVEEHGLKELDYPIVTDIQAVDYHALAERRHVSETIPAGTLKSALAVLVPYLPGIVLHEDQADGPAVSEQIFEDVQTKEALDFYGEHVGGWVWEITYQKKLRMFEPGTIAAPFNIDATTKTINGIRVKPTREGYANRVIVRTDTGRRGSAQDPAADDNPWELVVLAPDTTTDIGLGEIAQSVLSIALVELKRFQFNTYERGLRPGQTIFINRPERNVNNTFLITDVVSRHKSGSDDDPYVEHSVTAVEGLVMRTGYRDKYREWNKGGGRSVAGGWGGASGASSRFAYFLGGSGTEAVRSASPVWVPVAGGALPGTGSAHVQVNTVPRNTTQAQVTVRMRALNPGVTVKARLFNVTTMLPCPGESATVTGTDWATRVFTATLTPGSDYYELELLPGAGNAPVLGWGYLE